MATISGSSTRLSQLLKPSYCIFTVIWPTTCQVLIFHTGKGTCDLFSYRESTIFFSIDSINSCPLNEAGKSCSGHGVCIEGLCTCDAGYHGRSCQHEICPQNCSSHGFCNMEMHGCVCDEGWSGLDCGQPRERGFWTSVWSGDTDHPNATQTRVALARSQSSGSVWKGVLWVVGGHSLNLNMPFTMAFNISGKSLM